MEKILCFYIFFFCGFYYSQGNSYAGCNPNNGLYSDNNPEKIEYDNIITTFHTSVIKDAFNNYKIWGSRAASNGVDNIYSPQYINSSNYPALTGNVRKVALGAYTQLVVLTDDGLFASGLPGEVLPLTIKSTPEFEKLTINGEITGLPAGVTPDNVKMMFATKKMLMITTWLGEVFVLSESPIARGNGNNGTDTQWAKVMEDATTPLSDVIVSRGQMDLGFALKRDGTIWTWGSHVFSGKSTDGYYQDYDYATKMALPAGILGIKMIQATMTVNNGNHTYYLLDTNDTLHCLGFNGYAEFGYTTFPFVKVWTTSKYPDGSPTNNVSWISANEHYAGVPNMGVITKDGLLYTAGNNAGYVIGHGDNSTSSQAHPFKIPNGISATDVITNYEVGGHCSAAIKKGTSRYGYVGHRIQGSMGDGMPDRDSLGIFENRFDFTTTPEISVCGVSCSVPIIENNAPFCLSDDATFTIRSTPNDLITYHLNNDADQTIIIDNTGKYEINIPKSESAQTLKITKFSNLICSENVNITSVNTVIDNSRITIEETGKNAIQIIIVAGTPKYEYQLTDEFGSVIAPWQSSNSFQDLTTNLYKIQVRTENTNCVYSYNFIFLDLPNVITPNGDGKNDELDLSFLTKTKNATLEIFDRYGRKMQSFDNSQRSQNYVNFTTGTYYFIFTNDIGTKKSGWILIKKR